MLVSELLDVTTCIPETSEKTNFAAQTNLCLHCPCNEIRLVIRLRIPFIFYRYQIHRFRKGSSICSIFANGTRRIGLHVPKRIVPPMETFAGVLLSRIFGSIYEKRGEHAHLF